jgi:hypothetical protein
MDERPVSACAVPVAAHTTPAEIITETIILRRCMADRRVTIPRGTHYN